MADSQRLASEVKTQHGRLLEWAELYDGCEIEEKKMIISNIIDKVFIGKECRLDIKLKISFEQFLSFTFKAEDVEEIFI